MREHGLDFTKSLSFIKNNAPDKIKKTYVKKGKTSRRGTAKQQGVALLVVLLMMALMTTIAGTIANRMFMNFNRTESQVRYQQAYWYAQSVESLAKYGLQKSFSGKDTVTLSQPWAVQDQIYPLDGGQAEGSMFDRQACFNLNALKNIAGQSDGTNPFLVVMLQQLIESQGIENYEAEMVAASTWEYIDADDNVQSALGVEDSEYESRTTPYVTPNNFIADKSEWRAVNGVTQQIFQAVGPLLCAIPSEKLVINVNTLQSYDAPILSALFHPYLSIEQAQELINSREPVDGWRDVESFLAENVLSAVNKENRNKLKSYLDVRSRFFELETKITFESTALRMRALFKKHEDETVTVLRRRFGGVSEQRNTDDTTEQ